MEKIGMTYVGPWSYRGLAGAEYEALKPSRLGLETWAPVART
jgi:hypothetical protein